MVAGTHPQNRSRDHFRTARTVIIMIAELGVLQPGDRLMIEPDDDMVVEILGPRQSGP
jgi:hypothetical protein